MNDLNNNKHTFNLPTYINIPFFLYQDHRLEKSALLIAAFFYSLHTAGKSISASRDYLCALVGIGKTQYFSTLNQLESLGYVERKGFTNRKKMKWVCSPKSEIIVDETDTSAAIRIPVKNLNTSPVNRTKLVRDPELILSGIPNTDIKEDTKDNKKLTTVDLEPSSSSFFSEKQKDELLSYKIKNDKREDGLFLEHCQHHIESQENDFSKYQRITGLKNILVKNYELQELFKSKGFGIVEQKSIDPGRAPTQEEFDNWKNGVKGFEWVNSWRVKQLG